MTALSDELPSDELIAAERPAFEAWCKSEGIDAELWIKGQPQCGYTNARTTDYWTGWIARTRALLAAQPAQERQTYKPGNGGDCAICRQPEGDHYRHGNDCPDMRGVGQAE